VGKFMHHDHAQEFGRHILEYRCHMNLAAGLELRPMHPGLAGVHAERIAGEMQGAVESHLVERPCLAQVDVFQLYHIIIKRLVAAHRMAVRVFLQQPVAQPVLLDHLLDLLGQFGGVAGQIIRRWLGAHAAA